MPSAFNRPPTPVRLSCDMTPQSIPTVVVAVWSINFRPFDVFRAPEEYET
jgi:hypothetical protein